MEDETVNVEQKLIAIQKEYLEFLDDEVGPSEFICSFLFFLF